MPDSVPGQVFINGRFLSQPVTGVQRYARETLRSLDSLLEERPAPGIHWTLLVPRSVRDKPALHNIGIEVTGRLNGHLWEQFELPWRARAGMLFSFGLTGPLAHRHQVVTVHDANVMRIPEAYNWRFRLWYRLVVGTLVARATRTVAVSRFSADEAVACYSARPESLRIATEGWQHLESLTPDERIIDRLGLHGRLFALAVSSATPNKNFRAIAEALSLLGEQAPPCVVAGASNRAVFRGSDVGHGALHEAGYVSDAELKALYQHAACFVFPSFYEGFGIPPLEAMACGCPVIASTAAAVQEVCGDAALYFDPHRPEALAMRLRELFADASLRMRLSARGLERAGRFSWQENARRNLDFIQEALCRP
jgi:glycosyltransferase involved in cell wall biosynthesis